MKGISAVIAVVLILMITVALSAMAYVWFTGVFDTITEGAGEAAEGTADIISTSFSVQAGVMSGADTLILYLTNTGSSDIDLTRVNVFVDNLLATNTSDNTFTGILVPGDIKTLKSSNTTGEGDAGGLMECDDTMRIVYGQLDQTTSIVC